MQIFMVSVHHKWEVSAFQGSSDMPLKTHKIALDPNNKHRAWFAQQCRGRAYRDTKRLWSPSKTSICGTRDGSRKSHLAATIAANIRAKNPPCFSGGSMSIQP
ncbi:hypothetical protein F4212_04985 [Candidatus Poribacteria bacterium]|nr:hypothetical protein [Candidatus Poribacteria bacterium]